MTEGKIVAILGPVVDISFDINNPPPIFTHLKIGDLSLEIAAHLRDGLVRALALGSTNGLRRGETVLS